MMMFIRTRNRGTVLLRKCMATALLCFITHAMAGQQIISGQRTVNSFTLDNAVIYYDEIEPALVKLSAEFLQKDLQAVTGKAVGLSSGENIQGKTVIIVGTTSSSYLDLLVRQKKIDLRSLEGTWEGYKILSLQAPFPGVENALVVAGSDRRGVAYGVFELSKQMGVSPWYWWADVPVKKSTQLFVRKGVMINDAPKVKYRGIFINDEAPALSNWSREKFGGFNHLFYEKVFELILRLKGNYLWPAMWGNKFYDDDSLNIYAADRYGIVIGTSHHEPLMRAHDEWRKYGKGQKWNYDSTEAGLKEFWTEGMRRAWNEKIVTIGMRGDGDEPMTRETATALLERIVSDQRTIIEEVTGKPAAETPQLWALYKEVQDYYDKGMRVPDDVTLLLCDDNWGNIRKLPKLDENPRKGGYGIYYHFDYVGGPRNYKWVNTNPLPRIWEQMHLAWEYNARDIWIVNVGDIKPMEFPISFFLGYAWNPPIIGADDLESYTVKWAAQQFGEKDAKEISSILAKYGKYNARRKPELLDANTYPLPEYEMMVKEYVALRERAEKVNDRLPASMRDAYFQLVLHPVAACSNLYELYYNVALNKEAYRIKSATVNDYADKVKHYYEKDSLVTLQYHRLNNGKWNHMMSQTHIGYTYWQQPNQQKMPDVHYLSADSVSDKKVVVPSYYRHQKNIPGEKGKHSFYESDSTISIESPHFTRAVNTKWINWKILPDHGRTLGAVTTFPVTAVQRIPGASAPYLEYEIHTTSTGPITIHAYFSPTLNFHNAEEGLQYSIAIDNETPQVISINKDDTATGRGIWNRWVSENIIIKKSTHNINKPGRHIIRYGMVNSGVVLQKLVGAFAERKTYLGPPETKMSSR